MPARRLRSPPGTWASVGRRPTGCVPPGSNGFKSIDPDVSPMDKNRTKTSPERHSSVPVLPYSMAVAG